MNSREKILSTIKKSKPVFIPLAKLDTQFESVSEDMLQTFIIVLESMHSKIKIVKGWQEISDDIDAFKNEGSYVLNAIKEIENDRDSISQKIKSELKSLDYAFIKGEIAVTENGAIWIHDESFINRVLPFICKHLCLVIDAKNVVSNMHEAYQKIKINETGFGVFISGPSKTADIEQTLVIGAQGALEVTVYIIE